MAPTEQKSGSMVRRSIYEKALKCLKEAEIDFLVGGAYALKFYTGISRQTKDFDIFVHPDDHPAGMKALKKTGFETVLTFPHWLGKAIDGEYHIDIIFSSGNAIGRVDEAWFSHAPTGELLNHQVGFTPPEEMIWSKAFIMERDRFDGADILHLLLSCAEKMDWKRLLDRFGDCWRVFYSYLILFGFVYPSRQKLIPKWLMEKLSRRLQDEISSDTEAPPVCRGTLLSKSQYKIDIERWGFEDARKAPYGSMTDQEIAKWGKI